MFVRCFFVNAVPDMCFCCCPAAVARETREREQEEAAVGAGRRERLAGAEVGLPGGQARRDKATKQTDVCVCVCVCVCFLKLR